jgi:hypothetical protein
MDTEEYLKNEIHILPTERKSTLSASSSANIVKVHYVDRIAVYDNVHYPAAYIQKVLENKKETILKIELNGNAHVM